MYYVKNAPSLWSEKVDRELLEVNINRAIHYAAECIRNGQDAIEACNDAANRFSDTYDEYLAIWRRFDEIKNTYAR